MHHKRKKPKSSRSGCLLCKPHKRQGSCIHNRSKFSDWKRMDIALQKLNERIQVIEKGLMADSRQKYVIDARGADPITVRRMEEALISLADQ